MVREAAHKGNQQAAWGGVDNRDLMQLTAAMQHRCEATEAEAAYQATAARVAADAKAKAAA
jgi:hypothetical protein